MEQRISELGKYQGYSEKTYDGSQRSSDFETPVLDPAPVISLLHDATHLSFVEMPVVADT